MEPFRPTTLPVMMRLTNGQIVNLQDYSDFHLLEMDNLSRMYRFGARVDFTVADHIRLGLSLCLTDLEKKYWALHECWESLTFDCPTPLKKTWPWYIEQENKYIKLVLEKHGLDYEMYSTIVKPIDDTCYSMEEGHFFFNQYRPEITASKSSQSKLSDEIQEIFPEIYGYYSG